MRQINHGVGREEKNLPLSFLFQAIRNGECVGCVTARSQGSPCLVSRYYSMYIVQYCLSIVPRRTRRKVYRDMPLIQYTPQDIALGLFREFCNGTVQYSNRPLGVGGVNQTNLSYQKGLRLYRLSGSDSATVLSKHFKVPRIGPKRFDPTIYYFGSHKYLLSTTSPIPYNNNNNKNCKGLPEAPDLLVRAS